MKRFCTILLLLVAMSLTAMANSQKEKNHNNDTPYSVCEDFVDENTELIPAWRVMMTQKKNNSTSVYQHFVNCCEALGIKDVVPFL